MSDAYLYDAVRSARGKARADGGLAQLKPQQLVSALVDGLQERGNDSRNVQALVLGCVGQVGDQGANIALVSKLYAGVADDAYAFTLNNYCVSGLTAIGHAAAQVSTGQLDRALAGGVEMMSRVPFLGDSASYYTDASFPQADSLHSGRAGGRSTGRGAGYLAPAARCGCADVTTARRCG